MSHITISQLSKQRARNERLAFAWGEKSPDCIEQIEQFEWLGDKAFGIDLIVIITAGIRKNSAILIVTRRGARIAWSVTLTQTNKNNAQLRYWMSCSADM